MRSRRSAPRVFVGRLTIALVIAWLVMAGGVVAVNTVIADKAGQRSDTMMVIHIEPDAKKTLIVSIPRDLWVNIPGVGGSKINAAFNSGPNKVIDTLKSNFNIEINHYLELDFKSFASVVDAIGTVPIYMPYPARDDKTGLYIPFPGCTQLDGVSALAYVRSRFLEYYSLAVRQSLRDPLKANDIADRVVRYLTVDAGLTKANMLSLVAAFRDIDPNDPNALGFEVFPWQDGPQQSGQAVLYPKNPAWKATASRLASFGGAKSTATTLSSVAPASVTVRVLNGSGRNGIALSTLDSLVAGGFKGAGTDNDARGSVAATEIRYKAGARDKAVALAQHVQPSPQLVEDAQLSGADVALVLGSDFKAVVSPGAAASGDPTSSTSASGSTGSTEPAAGAPAASAPVSTSTFGQPAPKVAPC
jgi:LCP family protein required for cell wall assembly